jgi:hypothetical protein
MKAEWNLGFWNKKKSVAIKIIRTEKTNIVNREVSKNNISLRVFLDINDASIKTFEYS